MINTKLNVWSIIALCLFISAELRAESLYSDKQYYSLHEDNKAIEVGNIITVLIFEQASSSTSAGTDTDRDSSVAISSGDNVRNNSLDLGIGSEFSGGGTINRSGKLIASVSVTVKEIFDNGNMLIEGEQLIEFNDEKQFINLTGFVRPEDVSVDNTVISTRIADAKIKYAGDGLLGKQQKPGFIQKIFNWLF